MLVRSTVIDSDLTRVDKGIAFVRDRLVPAVEELEGGLGVSMLVNRATGHTVTYSMWGTRVAMAASGAALAKLRHDAGAILGGIPLAEEWEVAELYRARRDQQGFAVRSTRLEYDRDDTEHFVDVFRTTTVPALTLVDGFTGAELLVDRDRGVAVALTTFADRRALEDSRRVATEIRRTSIEKARARVTQVVESDLVLTVSHVPDQA